jgi:2-polyprenyl-3-methyl-5-hydroxy-6-metoxy-1,4-benzoquinol methylase
MMHASEQYAEQQHMLHENPAYGISGQKYATQIQRLCEQLGTRDVLDWGCGKATLQKNLPFPIQNYDPFVKEYSQPPKPADVVVVTDVMEHIEEDFVGDVLDEIAKLTKHVVFFQIATGPASKTLPDGRNAHITQHKGSWWMNVLLMCFEPISFQATDHGLFFIGSPLGGKTE